MNTRFPISEEIEVLISFLPGLAAVESVPIKNWGGGTKNQERVFYFSLAGIR